MKLKNTYITEQDVDILEEVLFILNDYAIKDDGERQRFVVDSFGQIVKDFKEADTV